MRDIEFTLVFLQKDNPYLFVCKKCGTSLNADENAAHNILKIGMGLKKIQKQKKNKLTIF